MVANELSQDSFTGVHHNDYCQSNVSRETERPHSSSRAPGWARMCRQSADGSTGDCFDAKHQIDLGEVIQGLNPPWPIPWVVNLLTVNRSCPINTWCPVCCQYPCYVLMQLTLLASWPPTPPLGIRARFLHEAERSGDK